MTQTAIPYFFMRGGTSRGPYVRRTDLPEDRGTLAKVLVAAVGSGHPLNIDGIGGGASVTTKVAMLSKGSDGWADVDYFFAQVSVEDGLVDFKPTCGNMLSAVGPAALEMGLVPARDGETEIKIHAVNTGARIVAIVKTPGGLVDYEGATAIDGVPGTAAPGGTEIHGCGGLGHGVFPTDRQYSRHHRRYPGDLHGRNHANGDSPGRGFRPDRLRKPRRTGRQSRVLQSDRGDSDRSWRNNGHGRGI